MSDDEEEEEEGNVQDEPGESRPGDAHALFSEPQLLPPEIWQLDWSQSYRMCPRWGNHGAQFHSLARNGLRILHSYRIGSTWKRNFVYPLVIPK